MLKEIPYIGYVMKQEVIKTGLKKLKGIIDIGRPATMTEAWGIIDVVH